MWCFVVDLELVVECTVIWQLDGRKEDTNEDLLVSRSLLTSHVIQVFTEVQSTVYKSADLCRRE